jgi:hypothetical protein
MHTQVHTLYSDRFKSLPMYIPTLSNASNCYKASSTLLALLFLSISSKWNLGTPSQMLRSTYI